MPRNITVTFDDGSSHVYQNAPDNLTPEQVSQRAQQDFGKAVTALDGGRKGASPKSAAPKQDKSALNAFILGARKPVENIARWAGPVTRAVDAVGTSLGFPASEEASSQNQMLREGNTRTGWQTVGNIAGTLPTARLPGGAFAQGAASGALLSDRKTAQGVATDSVIGGIGGKIGQGIVNSLAYAAKPVTSAAGRALYEAGIPQTVGQIARTGKGYGSKLISGLEDAATSIYGLGDAINVARSRGTENFNLSLGNRVLRNIGETLPKDMEAGDDMIKYVGKRLSDKYQQLVPKLVGNFDTQFGTDLAKAKGLTNTLPNSYKTQFKNIVDDVFTNRAKGKTISGQALKDAEADLTGLINGFKKSSVANEQRLGKAVEEVRSSLRAMIARSNPEHAAELQALNKGWAQIGTMRGAARSAGNASGVITPAQALRAARKGGFEDEFIKYAKETLPSELPDSGTAKRGAAVMALLAGGGGAGAVGVNPWLTVPAGAAIPYTKAGQAALNAFVYAPRGKAATVAGESLRRLGRFAPGAVPPLIQQKR